MKPEFLFSFSPVELYVAMRVTDIDVGFILAKDLLVSSPKCLC